MLNNVALCLSLLRNSSCFFFSSEYSSLSNTIDELNNYLDRWEQRHDNLRAQIREALRESQEEKSNQTTQINEEKTNDADSKPNNPNDSSHDSI